MDIDTKRIREIAGEYLEAFKDRVYGNGPDRHIEWWAVKMVEEYKKLKLQARVDAIKELQEMLTKYESKDPIL